MGLGLVHGTDALFSWFWGVLCLCTWCYDLWVADQGIAARDFEVWTCFGVVSRAYRAQGYINVSGVEAS